MNRQEVFDVVTKHLLTQRKCSENEIQCMYRGPEGLRCAVGALISDEDYDPEMEGKAVGGLIDCFGDKPSIAVLAPYKGLLKRLQRIHDDGFVGDWEVQLKLIAVSEGLTFNPPQNESAP